MQRSPNIPWYSLLAAVVLVPLAVGVVPIVGTPLTVNVFVSAKLIVLALTIAVALGAWALSLRSGEPLYLGRALIPLAVFVAVLAASTIATPDRRLAFFGDLEQGVGFLVFALCALAALLATQYARGERLEKLTRAVALTGAGIATIGLLQQVAGLDLVGIARGGQLPEWILQRGFGTIGNADTYAAYLVLPAVLAFYGLLHASETKERVVWGAATGVLVTSSVMAQTRGPLAGLIVGCAGLLISEIRLARRPAKGKSSSKAARPIRPGTIGILVGAGAAGVVATTIFGTALDFGQRFANLTSLRALGGRIPLWTSAIEIARKHLVLGTGPDSFRLAWYGTRTVANLATGTGLVITDPHSVPLLLLATTGTLGLGAALWLVSAALVGAAKTAGESDTPGEYRAWLLGAVALAITLAVSMLTTVTLFFFMLALGVLIAPRLQQLQPGRTAAMATAGSSMLLALALAAFAAMSFAGHVAAAGSGVDDPALAASRAARGASLAPWDTMLRSNADDTMVQSALAAVFTIKPDAADEVAAAEQALTRERAEEPWEYRHHQDAAVLLIGVGQVLGDDYTNRGVEAGLAGLEIYPNSLELRTGLASAFLALDKPARAQALLEDLWDADPNYAAAGVMYCRSLMAQNEGARAREVYEVLAKRFKDEPSVAELAKQLASE